MSKLHGSVGVLCPVAVICVTGTLDYQEAMRQDQRGGIVYLRCIREFLSAGQATMPHSIWRACVRAFDNPDFDSAEPNTQKLYRCIEFIP
jgi:hypothetical protein